MRKFVYAIIIAAIIVGGAGFYFFAFIGSPASNTKKEVIYEVTGGKSFSQISSELKTQHVIKNTLLFKIYARIIGQDSKIKVGQYALNTNMNPYQVLRVICSGKSIGKLFTISEGLNMYEIADLYEKQGLGKKEDFLKWARNKELVSNLIHQQVESAEGYLYPNTYSITKYMTAKDVVVAMIKQFLVIYQRIEPNIEISGFNRHDIVTLASIIEKETGAPEERRMISSVFHNRLVKKMKLQTDPTVLYGVIDLTKQPKNNITRKDLITPTRYNTYTNYGLPFGPIANPGEEALAAAVSPDSTNYLYFVSQNNGTHVFSETYEQHAEAVRKFQLNPKMRQGRSWRDLKSANK